VRDRFGLEACRGTVRRALRAAGLTWKRVKKPLGKAKPAEREAHVERLLALYEGVRDGGTCVVYVDESHFHRDVGPGYGWGEGRLWRVSGCPGLSERVDWYGAYDFSRGECLLWDGGRCNGANTAEFLGRVARWREGKCRVVVVWEDAPAHTARVAKARAEELGIERVWLPAYSPDLNPIERLWDWLRDGVTRGHCHPSVDESRAACHAALEAINADPMAVIDRLWPEFDLDEEVEDKLRISA
jgi:transposase